MPKSRRGARRKNVRRARPTGSGIARDQRRLIDRLLDTPDLAPALRQLQPEALHRIIEACGLEDCGDLVALATPDQLQRVFDVDLWRPAGPGMDEQLDASRFAVWLEVLMDAGESIVAEKLAGMDDDFVSWALAQHVAVFDRATGRSGCEVGNYIVEAKRTEAWDSILALLRLLDAEHPDYFHRVMCGCRRLSNSKPEADGFHELLTDQEQQMFDLTVDREGRREKQGYATPAQARAFLQSARQTQLGLHTRPAASPVVRAYFRHLEWTAARVDASRESDRTAPSLPPAPADSSHASTALVDVLREVGVLTPPPRGLLEAPRADAQRQARIHALMQHARDVDDAAYSKRTAELAYLTNAIAAGCSIQRRPFTIREASDAAIAVCNLGLENWPTQWLPQAADRISSADDAKAALHEDFLADHDHIEIFEVGWTVIHRDVCMYAAEALIRVLADLRTMDREIRVDLDALRCELVKHGRAGTPWLARDALDVILLLDQPAWAALLGLIDECPVIHAGMRASRCSPTARIDASAFEFISENSQIVSVREFLHSLPERLQC
jgi:Family of unknown function (DUF6178)